MATSYEKIYSNLLPKFRDYDIPIMTEDEVKELLHDFFVPAISSFHVCIKDLSDRDDVLEQFNCDLDDTEIEIKPDDIRIDTYRASGAGGQKVNKTSSAVRLTHIPTGIVVASQVERSQYQNRDVAMNMLISKLVEIKEREHLEKIEDIKGVQKEITWGSQIRSYVFMPYTMVKDHRTGFETGNIQAVMDGDLDGFINAYLKCASLGTLQK